MHYALLFQRNMVKSDYKNTTNDRGITMKVTDVLIQKYQDADEIYLLQRTKKRNKAEIALDWLVALFTPLADITEMADAAADMAYYYLVVRNDAQLLVRVEKGMVTEMDVTGLCSGKRFLIDGNHFRKVRNIHGKTV